MFDASDRTLSATFKFRLSEAERRILNANAAALGVTPSAYLRLASTIPARAIGIEEAAVGKSGGGGAGSLPRPPIVVYDKASILKLHTQLRRWGHCVNQLREACGRVKECGEADDGVPGPSRDDLISQIEACIRDAENMRERIAGLLDELFEIGGSGRFAFMEKPR